MSARSSSEPRGVLVVDLGAQYAQLIARRVREASVLSRIAPPSRALAAARDVLEELAARVEPTADEPERRTPVFRKDHAPGKRPA